MSYVTPLMSGTPSPGTCAPSFPTTRPTSTSSDFLPSETIPCADPQEVSLGYLAEPSLQVMNPRILQETRIHVSNHYSSTDQEKPDTYDSAQNLVTPPPESDLDDEQIRDLLASPHYPQEREANAERSQLYHSERENMMSSPSQDPASTGKPVELISSQNRSNQEMFSDNFSIRTSTGFGKQ